jgi:predicted aldo/keto reductase-like oxidoreductase
MERTRYGSTGLEISRLCLGTGHFAGVFPTPEAGADLLERAFHAGVTFWDTAEGYRSHPHVGAALRRVPRQQVQVQTKTGAVTCAAATASIEAALRDLGTDYLDVLLLHGVNSPRDYAARAGALEALLAARAAGKVRHVGCSTHIYTGPVIETVTAAPEVEVILATVNKGGVMLEGSIVEADEQAPRVPASPSMEEHIRQVRAAYEAGKGISIMKIIGGGRHAPAAEFEEWIRWAWDFPWAHALNLGICRPEELETDLRLGREHAARACRPPA